MKNFETTYQLRIGDVNYGGHLGQSQLAAILHDARIRYLATIGYSYSELNIEGVGLILIKESMELKNQAFPNEVITVCIQTTIEKSKFVFEYTVNNEKHCIATSIAELYFYDYSRKKVVKPPKRFVQKFHSS